MTPPCTRCHGVSYTSPLPEGWDRPSAEAPDCAAEAHWSGLRPLPPAERQALESWIRANYERVREEPRPFRIDLGSARLRAEIGLVSRRLEFGALGPYRAAAVNIDQGLLRSDWEVADNSLRLGLRELLSIQGIAVDGPAWVNGSPQSLRVGEFGQLHLISRATPSALFFLDPFMVPRPPMGHDMPSGEQWAACEARNAQEGMDAGLENCTGATAYPNHREDPRMDSILTSLLPPELLQADGRLPSNYNLETLISNFLRYRRNHPADPNAPRHDPLAIFEDWIEPGSHIDLDIERLNDFFLPGLIDLGPSRGTLRVSYAGNRRFLALASDFEIQLDPIGYPAQPNGERSPFVIDSAYISATGESRVLDGGEIPPGLRAEYNATSGELWLEGNLAFHSDMTVPLWGDVEFSGSLALRTALRQVDGEWRPLPGATHLELHHGELWETGGRRPILTNFRLDVSDTDDSANLFRPAFQGFRVQVEGYWGRSGFFDAELELPVPGDAQGSYDFANLIQELPARLALRFHGGQSYEASLTLLAPSSEENRRQILASLDIDRGQGEGRRPMLEEGRIQIELERQSELQDGFRVGIDASRFSAFGLDLNRVGLRLHLERLQHQEGLTEVRIPSFRIWGNPRGGRRGLLRGPFDIELQRPVRGGAFALSWNGPERRLSFRDLDLRFSLQGIHLAPLQSQVLRRNVDPRVAALGVDGRVQGFLDADLPIDRNLWRARGSIGLRGDRDGDIYFLDASGRRVGQPLIRDTRWRFMRVDRVNWRRGYALGRFHLDTLLNFSSLLPPFPAGEVSPAYGLRGQPLRPYEINGVMPYDNQPWDLRGFRNRIVDYLTTLCRRDPRCREELR